MNLSELERSFWQAVRTRGAPPAGLGEWLTGSARQSPTERLAVYHVAYWQRQVAALANSFPRLHALLGAQQFERVLLAYIEAYPGTEPCIEMCGQGLVEFLATRCEIAPLPMGVARLEWAGVQSLLAADPPSVAALPRHLGDSLAGCRLVFVPSLRTVHVPLESLSVFAPGGQGVGATVNDASVVVVFCRPHFTVLHLALEADESRALALALEGGTIGEVCEAFASLPEAQAVARASSVLSGWFARRWVANCAP